MAVLVLSLFAPSNIIAGQIARTGQSVIRLTFIPIRGLSLQLHATLLHKLGIAHASPFYRADLFWGLYARYAQSGVAVEDDNADLAFRDLPPAGQSPSP